MDLEKIVQTLRAKNFTVYPVSTAQDALATALEVIPADASVGFGGSMSVKQIGLDQALAQRGNDVYAHGFVPQRQAADLYRMASSADWYVASANALTESGDLVNIDGTANRVASLMYGVKNILYVIGKNKIVADLDAAINRIRNYAAPLNAKRLGRNVPCVKTGKCSDCPAPECICNVTTIVHHPTKYQTSVHIVLVDETLGL